ncbi:MAG: N-acetylneuraminate synthase family protein [Pirellulales bacterium]|nr:N-acetylneuraminate synthase family protein [Pirellulales bacterium]
MPYAASIELTPGRVVGVGFPCYLVAEIGQNHNGNPALAQQLIERLSGSEIDAVKFCKRHLQSDLTEEFSRQTYDNPNSFAPTYGEHRQALELPEDVHQRLQSQAGDAGLTCFATACDHESVELLERLNVPCYKVASRDLTNLPLIEHIATTGKPVILSSGMDGLREITDAVNTVRAHHHRMILLHCTSAYPTRDEDVNLRAMETLRTEFDCPIGLSDHSLGTAIPLAAVALGACLIEKHVTLNRKLRGSDHICSLEPDEFVEMGRSIRRIEAALGDGVKRVVPAVNAARRKLGRTLVAKFRIPSGTQLTEAMLCLKTAGGGIPWNARHQLIGRTVCREIPADSRLDCADVE